MPYKNSEEKREALKKWRAKQREGLQGGTSKEGISEGLQGKTPSGTSLPPAWQSVVNYLRREGGNLGKLQAISGALGKLSEQVFFGGLTVAEVGEVLGTGAPVIHEPRMALVERDYCGRIRGPMDIREVTPLCLRTDDHVHSRATV